MVPSLFKTETLHRPATIDELHEKAVVFAEKQFKRKGAAPFMWLLGDGNSVVWIETPWQSSDEKLVTMAWLTKSMKKRNIHVYSHVVEAWMAKDKADNPDPTPPSQRRKEDRDDVLLVLSFDKQGHRRLTRYLVTVRPRGRGLSFLGPRDDETFAKADHMDGRLWDLLDWTQAG